MTRWTRMLLTVIAVVWLGGGRTTSAADPSTGQLRQQIEQLQDRVQQLEAQQQAQVQTGASTQARAVNTDSTVDKVLRDAPRQSKMLDLEGFTAGFDGARFALQDARGDFVFRPDVLFQFRSVTNWREHRPVFGFGGGSNDESDTESGFEVARMKFGADGNVFSPAFQYFFLVNAQNGDFGMMALEQAWGKYDFGGGGPWSVRVGQFINPVVHEQAIGAENQLGVDRSLANSLITLTDEARTQAVSVIYSDRAKPLSFEAGFGDGFNSQNTPFMGSNGGRGSGGGGTNLGGFGRVNYAVIGGRGSRGGPGSSRASQNDYNTFTARQTKENTLIVGGGADITQLDVDSNTFSNYVHTADITWKSPRGIGVYGAFLGNYIHASGHYGYEWGLLLQASCAIRRDWEIFGRFDYAKLDYPLVFRRGDSFCEFTVGGNWYVLGTDSAKLTLEVSVLPSGSSGNFLAPDALNTGDVEVILRGQLQLKL
jgi:hypothetical protein